MRLLFGLAAYLGTSYYLLKHPQKVHLKHQRLKLPPVDTQLYIIPHRGGSLEAPENTLQAFKKCVNRFMADKALGG